MESWPFFASRKSWNEEKISGNQNMLFQRNPKEIFSKLISTFLLVSQQGLGLVTRIFLAKNSLMLLHVSIQNLNILVMFINHLLGTYYQYFMLGIWAPLQICVHVLEPPLSFQTQPARLFLSRRHTKITSQYIRYNCELFFKHLSWQSNLLTWVNCSPEQIAHLRNLLTWANGSGRSGPSTFQPLSLWPFSCTHQPFPKLSVLRDI